MDDKNRKAGQLIHANMSRSQVETCGRRGATGTNLAKVLDTFYLYTDENEKSVGQWLSMDGFWEAWITSWMSRNIKPGDTCVDIGANYGYYTRLMEAFSGKAGRVYSFEANPDLSELLRKSRADHPLENGAEVECHEIAVSEKKGFATLSIPSTYLGGASMVRGRAKLPSNLRADLWDRSIEVETDRMDNRIQGPVDIIKMDIEGAEPLAWKGMRKILRQTAVVVMELGAYSPACFLDEIYDAYNVTRINFQGDEELMERNDFCNVGDPIMAVLRRKQKRLSWAFIWKRLQATSKIKP